MKKVKQFRYYGNGNTLNEPGGMLKTVLTSGHLFDGIAISQLGIQGRPNTCFYLNETAYPIILGDTGIYELDLQDRGTITSIAFVDNDAFKHYETGDRLLIDVVFEDTGG